MSTRVSSSRESTRPGSSASSAGTVSAARNAAVGKKMVLTWRMTDGAPRSLDYFAGSLIVTAIAMVIAGNVAMIAKHHLACRRPGDIGARVLPMLPTPDHGSFPSGHATSAVSAAMMLSEDDEWWPLYVVLAALVASSRIYVKIHHASDVAGGLAIGKQLERPAVVHRDRLMPGDSHAVAARGAGVIATRYSSVLISVGTPTFIGCQSSLYVTNSRARSASQNSIRSRALDRSRPVSCSTRLMRYRSVCLWQ